MERVCIITLRVRAITQGGFTSRTLAIIVSVQRERTFRGDEKKILEDSKDDGPPAGRLVYIAWSSSLR